MQNTIILPTIPTAYSDGCQISTLVILGESDPRQVKASSINGGWFTRLITSRPEIITLLTAAMPAQERSIKRDYKHPADEPGLYILPVNFKASDWLLVVEEHGGCDPGWVYHLVLGKLPDGVRSASELFAQVTSAVKLLDNSKGTTPFQEFQLWPPQPRQY